MADTMNCRKILDWLSEQLSIKGWMIGTGYQCADKEGGTTELAQY